MKFVCDNCQQRYHVDDKKVGRRTLRIRCKQCGSIIVVRDPGIADSRPSIHPARASAVQRIASRRPAGTQHSVSGSLQKIDELAWHYARNGKSFGPFEEDDLIAKFLSGQIGDEAFVWNADMDGWRPATEIPVFVPAISEGKRRHPKHPTLNIPAMELDALKTAQQAQQQAEEQPGWHDGEGEHETLLQRPLSDAFRVPAPAGEEDEAEDLLGPGFQEPQEEDLPAEEHPDSADEPNVAAEAEDAGPLDEFGEAERELATPREETGTPVAQESPSNERTEAPDSADSMETEAVEPETVDAVEAPTEALVEEETGREDDLDSAPGVQKEFPVEGDASSPSIAAPTPATDEPVEAAAEPEESSSPEADAALARLRALRERLSSGVNIPSPTTTPEAGRSRSRVKVPRPRSASKIPRPSSPALPTQDAKSGPPLPIQAPTLGSRVVGFDRHKPTVVRDGQSLLVDDAPVLERETSDAFAAIESLSEEVGPRIADQVVSADVEAVTTESVDDALRATEGVEPSTPFVSHDSVTRVHAIPEGEDPEALALSIAALDGDQSSAEPEEVEEPSLRDAIDEDGALDVDVEEDPEKTDDDSPSDDIEDEAEVEELEPFDDIQEISDTDDALDVENDDDDVAVSAETGGEETVDEPIESDVDALAQDEDEIEDLTSFLEDDEDSADYSDAGEKADHSESDELAESEDRDVDVDSWSVFAAEETGEAASLDADEGPAEETAEPTSTKPPAVPTEDGPDEAETEPPPDSVEDVEEDPTATLVSARILKKRGPVEPAPKPSKELPKKAKALATTASALIDIKRVQRSGRSKKWLMVCLLALAVAAIIALATSVFEDDTTPPPAAMISPPEDADSGTDKPGPEEEQAATEPFVAPDIEGLNVSRTIREARQRQLTAVEAATTQYTISASEFLEAAALAAAEAEAENGHEEERERPSEREEHETPPENGSNGNSRFRQLDNRGTVTVNHNGHTEEETRANSSDVGADYFVEDFPRVFRAVQRCHEIQMRESRGPTIERVVVDITVQPNGDVSLGLEPDIQNTAFARCLQTRYQAWSFRRFEGDAVTLQRTYALQ